MESKNVLLLSIIAMAKNSVGAGTWKTRYVLKDGELYDATQNGGISCSFFASTILRSQELLETVHLRTESTVADMERSGWFKIDSPRAGAVVVYKPTEYAISNGLKSTHMGFCVTDTEAVSNDDITGTPQMHSITECLNGRGEKRSVDAYYWHPKFDEA